MEAQLTFAERFKRIRTAGRLKLTQAKLAHVLGLSRKCVNQIETGRVGSPQWDTISRLEELEKRYEGERERERWAREFKGWWA